MKDGRPAYNAGLTILYVNYAINGVASLLTLMLMGYMWMRGRLKFNLYTKCVLQMTFYQMIYELTDPMIFEVSHPGSFERGERYVLSVHIWECSKCRAQPSLISTSTRAL